MRFRNGKTATGNSPRTEGAGQPGACQRPENLTGRIIDEQPRRVLRLAGSHGQFTLNARFGGADQFGGTRNRSRLAGARQAFHTLWSDAF
jgi:hypothetical protein